MSSKPFEDKKSDSISNINEDKNIKKEENNKVQTKPSNLSLEDDSDEDDFFDDFFDS